MHSRWLGYVIVSAGLVLGGVWVAANVNLTTFQPGTTIVASEVNANFQALADGIDNVYTKAEVDALLAALTTANVAPGSLRLGDLGESFEGWRTTTTGAAITLAAGACGAQLTGNFGSAYIGHLVVGTLADASGSPVLANAASVVPSVVIGTTQGGAVPNIVVCNTGTTQLTVPAGSVFTWRMIAP
jgi:hypothetical protein